jgi:hypothetical protein
MTSPVQLSCWGNEVRQTLTRDQRYDTVREAARRLTIGVPSLHRLINNRMTPVQCVNGRRKIAKLVVGQLLASAYEIWPPERRPHYSVEELRKLSGITVRRSPHSWASAARRATRPFATIRSRRESSLTATGGSSRRMWSLRWSHTTSGICRPRLCRQMDVGLARLIAKGRTG